MALETPTRDSVSRQLEERKQRDERIALRWARRRDIPIAILAWLALAFVFFWAIAHIIQTVLLVIIASLLAFALYPGVKLLSRFIPRFLAILIMYLLVLGTLALLLYLIINTAIVQGSSLVKEVEVLLTPGSNVKSTPLIQTLNRIGISTSQINGFRSQLTSNLGSYASSAVPYVLSFLNFLIDLVVVAVLSIYFVADGSRVGRWLRANMPMQQRSRTRFLLDTLQHVVGGYIRGQLTLSALIGVLVGVGMTIFHVPYSVLLGVMAFILEFIPLFGVLISGAICVLIALTQGWVIAVLVLAYFVIVHVIEGDVVGPRIVGRAVGLHPAISLIAVITGYELFGVWGMLLGSPIAGVIQALVVAFYSEWRASHPDQFPGQHKFNQAIADNVADRPVDPQSPSDGATKK
jgi:predicted PurR-regulated permease PerM